jgi:hypothetical protein
MKSIRKPSGDLRKVANRDIKKIAGIVKGEDDYRYFRPKKVRDSLKQLAPHVPDYGTSYAYESIS